ncbi:MAG: hypothetical protein K0R71_1967 [Bacillales bacterium]|jgi:hypothetical protein|nr:hypothetical protein [Bacillales bacterium]
MFRRITFDELFYSEYFSMAYHTKYGYFDFKPKGNYEYDYVVSNLVYRGIFNTEGIMNNFEELKPYLIDKQNRDTSPMELSTFKNEDERRILKLPNMYSYLKLCMHLCENKSTYIEILSSSQKSLSNGFYETTFLTNKIKKEKKRLGNKFIFKTDIQNFYHSIYTHSIPWVLVGKQEAKKERQSGFHNELDSLVQKCQCGETYGIPTGSFAIRLIAEVYMCVFDKTMEKYNYSRYVDDFEFPFNEEVEKSRFYTDLYKELSNLNLKIKKEKNNIDSFPFKPDNDSDVFFEYFSKTKNSSKYIHRFIDFSVEKEREGFKGSIKLMFKTLEKGVNKNILEKDSFTSPILLRLFNFVLMSPQYTIYFLEMLDTFDCETTLELLRKGINNHKNQIIKNIERYIDLNFSQEVYSILSIFHKIRLTDIFDDDLLKKIILKMDDISSILAMEMKLSNSGSLSSDYYEIIETKLSNSKSWDDEYWFFKYHFMFKIHENNKSDFNKNFKNFIFEKYANGKNRSSFFNQNNIRKLDSPINLHFQNKNSHIDICKFFEKMLDLKISFVNLNKDMKKDKTLN